MIALILMFILRPDAIMAPSFIRYDFPKDFQKGEVSKYINCLRTRVNAADQTWNGPDPQSPEIVQFTQTMTYCGAERSQAEKRLRNLIQTRRPDWQDDQLSRSVEFVLSELEIELLQRFHNFEVRPVHGPAKERF